MATSKQRWLRTRCLVRGWRGGGGAEDDFLTTFYQLLLVALCCVVGSLGQNNFFFRVGEVTPVDPYVLEGSPLTLTCTIKESIYNGPLTAHDLFFKIGAGIIFNNSSPFFQVQNDLTAVLHLPNVSAVFNGSKRVNCNLTPHIPGGHPTPVGAQWIHVAKPLIKPVIEKCVVRNWEELRCVWSPREQNTSLQQNGTELFWSNGTEFLERNHSHCPKRNGNVCTWVLDKYDLTPYQEGMTLIVVAIARSNPPHGSNVSMLDLEEQSEPFFVNASLIAKPYAVSELIVIDQELSNIKVQWQPPVSDRKLVYHVQYKSHWQEQWHDVSLYENEWTLEGATPHTRYNISVRSKPLHLGLWSNSTNITFTTPSEVPSKNPEVQVGSYVSHSIGAEIRTVTLYWKALEPQHRNGPQLNYYVYLTNEGDCLIKPHGFTSPLVKLVPHSDVITSYNVTARQACAFNFSVQAENILGLTPEMPRGVTVTPADPLYGASLGIVADAQSARVVNMSWRVDNVQPDTISHTVYWCRGHHTNKKCLGKLEWTEVPMPKRSLQIHLEEGEVYSDFIFAVSRNRKAFSGGMVWSLCTFDVNYTSPAPEVVNVSTSTGPGSIGVAWFPVTCSRGRGHVLHYIIYYCVAAQSGHNCSGELMWEKVSGDVTSHVLRDLEASLTYRVTMRSDTAAGPSPFPSKPVFITTTAPWATPGVIAVVTIVGIVFLILVIGGLTALVCKYRKFHSWFTGLRIELPDKLSNGGVMRGTSTSSSQPLRLHSYGDPVVVDHHSQQQQQHLFYNQQFSVESDNSTAAMLPQGGGGGVLVGGGGPDGRGQPLPLRQCSSFSDTSDPDDVFNNTLNTTDGGGSHDDQDLIAMETMASSLAVASPPPSYVNHPPQKQMTTYQIDAAKQHPMNAEHANKNGYVKMGDNGVIPVFPQASASPPSVGLPKLDEEE